jgi:hypothetical protein
LILLCGILTFQYLPVMSNPVKYTLLYCLFLLTACTYEPEEIFFKEILKPDHEAILSLNDYDDADTIILFGPADFSFRAGIVPGIIQSVEVRLNNTMLVAPGSHTNMFSIRDDNLKTGIYALEITFISSNGSGSLADVAGGELIKVSRTWIVTIDVDPPPPTVLSLVIENGFLKLKWNSYTKQNFVKYTVTANAYYEPQRTINITDPNENFLIDSGYVGGRGVSYSVATYAFGFSSSYIVREDLLPEITVEYDATDSTAIISWHKSDFPGALKNYEIVENNISRQVITNPNDSSITLKLNVVWNMTSVIKVRYNSAYSSFTPEVERQIYNTVIRPRLPVEMDELYFNTTANGIFSYRNSYLVSFNSTLQPIDSVAASSDYSVPFSGPYIYFAENFQVVQHNLITKEQ